MATAAAMEKDNSGDLRDLPSEFLPASEASESAFTELKTPESEPSQSDSKVWEDGLPLETLESTVEPMKPAEDVQEPESVRSWFVLLATFTAMLFSYGISFSSGIWQRYFYSTEYFGPQSQKTLAWIGSIAYAFSTASGMVVGPASDYFGHQKMLGVGTVLFSLSWLLSSFANSVYILYITQGAMLGVSLACLLIPSGGVLVTYWTRRRALAISLAGTGGGFGGFLWPPVIQALLDKIGVVWTYRTMALISIIVLGLCTAVLRPAGAPKKVDRKANFIDPAFFSSRHYWLLSGVGFAITTGYYLPTYYFPQYATDNGLTPQQASLLISIMNIAGLLVRVIQGPLSRLFSPTVMFASSICLASLCQYLIWPFARSFGAMVGFVLAYGAFATGGYHGFYPIVVNRAYPTKYASAIGLIYFWCFLPGLVGPVICGILFDRYSEIVDGVRVTNYVPMICVGASCIMIAGIIAWIEVYCLRQDSQVAKRHRTDEVGGPNKK